MICYLEANPWKMDYKIPTHYKKRLPKPEYQRRKRAFWSSTTKSTSAILPELISLLRSFRTSMNERVGRRRIWVFARIEKETFLTEGLIGGVSAADTATRDSCETSFSGVNHKWIDNSSHYAPQLPLDGGDWSGLYSFCCSQFLYLKPGLSGRREGESWSGS